MTLQKREKTLAIALVAVLAATALYFVWPSQGESLAVLRSQLDSLEKKSQQKKIQAAKATKAKERLTALQRQALPPEQEIAQSSYQNWLRKLVDDVDFKNVNFNAMPVYPVRDISSSSAASSRNAAPAQQARIYTRFPYNIQCEGTLVQLTKFLYEFYSAGHLHKINSLNITPIKNSAELELNITIDALSLPGSTQKDKLSTETLKRLKLPSLDEYKKAIVGRNLFAAYASKPVKDGNSKPAPKVDPLEFSYLTAIIEADGVAEAWLHERTSGETFRVHEGEEFTIGKVKGKVNRIGYNDIEIEIDGKNRTVDYGHNLKM